MASEKAGTTEGNGKAILNESDIELKITSHEPQTENESEEAVEYKVEYKDGLVDIPEETIAAFGGDELRARVFYEKYALRDKGGRMVEKTPEEMWHRVAREISSPEKTEKLRKEWHEKFYWLLSDFRFIPGGRILFGAGQKRRATLLNCYFMPIKEDSIEGVFEWCKEAARTYSFGGGVGTDISILRPKGAPVNNSAIYSTGAVSFMDLLSTTTGTIGQAGRRGALMITMDVDHPDILDFIDIKNDPARSKVRFANISIKVTDEFMRAVEEDGDFELRFENEKARIRKKIRARDLWEKLIRSAWASAEPGLIFWDGVKRFSPTEYNGMEVHGVNPCSEQALEDYGNCCLGNINMSLFVNDEFTERARIDWENLEKACRLAVRFLDNILDYNANKHPLKYQTDASSRSRRIGVGFTGFGDMLAKLNLKYDTTDAVQFADKMFEHIKNTVYEASSDTAAEKGSFPAFDLETHLSQPFLKTIDEHVTQKIRKQGLRNACILTVPPVGSGSVLAGTTSGIEPIFALSYYRRSKSLSREEFKVYHPLVGEYVERFVLRDESELPRTFVTSHEIEPEMRVRMQAAIQKHIDSCISSTVNLPADITLDEVENIYFLAWKLGCKGITVYREGSREGILVTEEGVKAQEALNEKKVVQSETPQAATRDEGMQQKTLYPITSLHPSQDSGLGTKGVEAHHGVSLPEIKPVKRPQHLEGFTEAIKTGYGNLYVTVNKFEGRPFEVFVQIGKSGYTTMADAEAIGRLVSLALRSGISVKDVVEQLEGIGGASPVFSEGKLVMSIPDAIAAVLKKHFVSPAANGVEPKKSVDIDLERCPDCGSRSLAFEQGCINCKSCGFSKCD
ncbi:MAG TPA: adenosylcobalamin-dependent ribonucleoside-diphosphate reductase [Thermodesulfobacteriota bacterium]|nr:adenosylcobalamin-dependent ribonucleoside-diphosphate reductase [Thermodesulfobacteriota bacterium]